MIGSGQPGKLADLACEIGFQLCCRSMGVAQTLNSVQMNVDARNVIRGLFAAAVVIGISACSHPVGTGSAPYEILLYPAGGALGDQSTRIHACVPSSVTAEVKFTDGSIGNFTSRVAWSSSDAGVVDVSNGKTPDPLTNGNFAAGALIPHGAGTATVTAEFEGLSSQLQVNVGETTGLAFKREGQFEDVPVTTTELGVGTTQTLILTGLQDGIEKNLTGSVAWSAASNSSVSVVTGNGLLTGLGSGGGGPSQVFATLPLCGEVASIPVTTADVSGISATTEFGTDPLIVGNNEAIFVTATLADGTTQDVSTQATLTSSLTEFASFSSAVNSRNLLIANEAYGEAVINTSLATSYGTFYASPLYVTTTPADLLSITIAPAYTPTLMSGSDQAVNFHATGTFSNGQVQDVTRVVDWTIGNTSIAQVNNILPRNGQVSVASTATGTVGTTVVQANETVNSVLISSPTAAVSVGTP